LYSKHVSKSDELNRQENAAVPTAKASSVSVHVQLYVIEDIYDSLSDSFKKYLDKVTLNKRIGHDSLLMSSVARLVLDVRFGARVNLEVVTSASEHRVSEIQITPLGNLEMSAKELETLFRCYVAEQVQTHGLLINSESFLTLQATASSTAHVQVSLLPSDMEYAILDPDCVRKCKFTVKDKTSHLVYPSFNKELATNDNCDVHFGSYFKELLSEGITTLELSLHLTPLVARPLSLRANFISDNILILGTAGSGKSTLARTMCRELEKPPHFVHWVEVQCIPLKGKRVETLHKLISQLLRECMCCQPAVVMFDDLEAIAGIGASAPGQPESEDSYYYTRVGERLSELLEEFQSSNSISVIATAPSRLKVNSSLVAPRGRHMFKTVLEIPELNKGDRLDILKSIVSQRSGVTVDSVIPLNWSQIAGRTEGYVMQDLVDLTDKAIFQACRKAVSAQERTEALNLELDTSDFEEALNNSVPLLQRGVEFFHSSSSSWDDIGGLSDVKKILIEVLQWPSQYPEIFENAPLRVQSGLLLYGAPGTGKTLLAGAVAKECGLKFISIKGPELLSKYIGASEEAVRKTFQKAQSAKPCILFFDEFDSLAPRRGHDNTGVTDRVVNQLLTQLDGVESLRGVSVVAATSRPDLIDPALLRPGRLDRIVKCPLPDRDDRLSILRALSRRLVLSDDINFGEIADETEGFTGADLQAVLYTALLQAVEQNIALCEVGDNKVVKQEPVTGDSRIKSEKVTNGPVVTQASLKTALKDTKPSLSDMEKLRYRLIYEKFERSRGGTSAEEMAALPQRATLA
jgi:peroxin-1